jgi:peptidoglycan/LPS O-acetylase OafA/YrhL
MTRATPLFIPRHPATHPDYGLLGKDSSNLDLLRSVAVLAVFIAHLLATFDIHQVFSVNLKPLGWAGVLMFFVHTSLVLMMSMDRLAATGWRLFASFYVRRIFRIYPLSICCVIAVVVLRIPSMPWVPAFAPVSWSTFVSNLLLIQNLTWRVDVIGALWSLPFEVQMYVVLPFLFLAARRYASPALAIGLWLLFIPLGLLVPRLPQLQVGGIGNFQYIPCFLGGVAAYQCAVRMPARRAFWIWPASILAFMAIYVGFNASSRGWIECLLLGLVAPRFRETSMAWLKKLSHTVAQYSYGIYLLHPPLMWVAFKKLHALPIGIQWAVFLVLMTTLCFAAYHWIESPLLKTGGKLAKRFQVRTKLQVTCGA